jgi:hypothetical protein
MKKKYYKVVKGIDGDICSVIDHGDYTTKYKLNEWTTGISNTRLFVFDTLENAQKYASSLSDRIYECECKGVIKNAYGTLFRSDYTDFWNMVNKNIKNKKKWDYKMEESELDNIISINGACFAKSVKLLKQV